MISRLIVAVLALAVVACRGDSSGPAERDLYLRVGSGTPQFGSPGEPLLEPFTVIVTENGSDRLAAGARVRWRITQGAGNGVLAASETMTDGGGVARTTLRLGADTGTVVVEADVDRRVGGVALFEARAVRTPMIASIAPQPIIAGSTATIDGANFSTRPDDHTVVFGGRRGRVTAATP
jgi:hypothetical protein